MNKIYDVIIVGAGPAGIFTALELLKDNNKVDILMLEKGKNIDERKCPMREQNIPCQHCKPCSLLAGWGGAGAFSDGKLNLTGNIGGQLSDYISSEELGCLIKYVDDIYLQFGADEKIYGNNQEEINLIRKASAKANLKFISARVRHLGTEKCSLILNSIYNFIKNKVQIRTSTEVKEIIEKNNKIQGIITTTDEVIHSRYVVLSPGRVGSEWLKKQSLDLGLSTFNNPVDVGVRVELPAIVMEHITDIFYESKLVYYTAQFDDQVRTFCMCPHGEVVLEYNNEITTVNGHSYTDKKTNNTNFALLVSTNFTEPFKDPIAYGRFIANLANILSGGVIVQRLGDLLAGRRSTIDRIKNSAVIPTLNSATPGDLSFVLPYRILSDILETLKALDKIAPGTYCKQTLLYGVEVKFYSVRIKLSRCLETEVENLYAIGDGAGITRGLIQASISGVITAREIKSRLI
ncbi:MAG: NAD(P)/FAD-dependent oxidoreductase [Candidatus Caldatribacteriota bacterium]|nr:NAD(P)/FAD-dependent oxidoreductase [Atribacterota bacterium]MDD3031586.1 NAD(P)/FAD-dependent oxidoreductase [Atribacterota bacterium]MDD4288020.1 NAD(P)/FAD-dependent oxidoreductase [Atribacterota bacterium]